MFINAEHINNIAIATMEKPIDFAGFKRFINKSPFVRRIAFVGKSIFELPEFAEMVKFCAVNQIALIFGEVCETSEENLYALVQNQNVLFVNLNKGDPTIEKIQKIKAEMQVKLPNINIIKTVDYIPQNDISETSFAFYNMADNLDNCHCWNLLKEPMINFDGGLLGCWQNNQKTHPINAFDIGLEKALNHSGYKKILRMLRTGKIDTSCQCARCPMFLSLIWSGKTLDVYKHVFQD